MKLPQSNPPSTEFKNAEGSDIPQEYALAARIDPEKNIPKMAETKEEECVLKKEALVRQYVLLIDRSGSMSWPDRGRGSRWMSAQKATEALVPVLFKHDVDKSIPIYLFDSDVTFVGECTDVSQVQAIFNEYQPGSTTNLAQALDTAMQTYLGSKRANYELVPGTTFIVFLDGGADDKNAVIQTLQKYADPANGYIANHTQAAVSFIQIADDHSATEFLQSLDDLKPLDIVDTKKDDLLFTGPQGIEQLLHDAVFD